MSLSRKLIEKLVKDEIIQDSTYNGFNKEKLNELAIQVFLIQATQTDQKDIRKSIQDKIDHFNSIMSE